MNTYPFQNSVSERVATSPLVTRMTFCPMQPRWKVALARPVVLGSRTRRQRGVRMTRNDRCFWSRDGWVPGQEIREVMDEVTEEEMEELQELTEVLMTLLSVRRGSTSSITLLLPYTLTMSQSWCLVSIPEKKKTQTLRHRSTSCNNTSHCHGPQTSRRALLLRIRACWSDMDRRT